MATALMVMGAGCSQTTSNSSSTATDNQKNSAPPTNVKTLTLVASALGNREVKIQFGVPEVDTKDAEGYRILMGKTNNPDMKTASDWYTLGETYREKIWSNRPEGKRHFRVCVMKKNTCASYSNNVEVDIK